MSRSMLMMLGNAVRGHVAWEMTMARSAPLSRAWPASPQTWSQMNRFWSKTKEAPGKAEEGATEPSPEATEKEPSSTEPPPPPSPEEIDPTKLVGELQALVRDHEEKQAKLSAKVEELTDRLKRTLAETENVRTRSTREVDNAKRFGPQALIKDLLDVPDNLERATSMVPASVLVGEEEPPLEATKVRALLRSLVEGVQATEKILLQVLRKQGVEQYNPMGEKFDPNLHNALFEVPDGTREPGVIAAVTKRGYRLHERVIRPAEVGVSKAPPVADV